MREPRPRKRQVERRSAANWSPRFFLLKSIGKGILKPKKQPELINKLFFVNGGYCLGANSSIFDIDLNMKSSSSSRRKTKRRTNYIICFQRENKIKVKIKIKNLRTCGF